MFDHPGSDAAPISRNDGMAERERFLRFLLAGGTSALLNSISRWVFDLVMPFEAAVALAYGIGLISAYALMRAFVFKADAAPVQGQSARFVLVNVYSFLQVWLISVALLRLVFPAVGFAWHSDTVAHVLGLSSLVVTSYLAHRNFTFKVKQSSAGHSSRDQTRHALD